MDPTTQIVNVLQAATVLLLSPLLAGIAGRIKGLTESRVGPPILQPYYDLAKYLRKETLVPAGSSRLFLLAPFVAFGAYLVISVVVPIITPYPLPYASTVDFLGGGLLFGLAGLVTLLAALAAGSNYTALGASRTVSFSALGEPTLIMIFFGVAVITGTNNPYVTNNLLASSFSAYLSPTHLLVVAAFFLLLLAETGKLPVESSGLMEFGMLEDGRTFGHSGRLLGLFRWNGWMKQFLLYSVFVNVFALPWGMSDAVSLPGALENIVLLLGKLLLVVGVVAGVEATLAKVRLFKIRDFLALSFSLAILSIFVFVVVGVP
ncbi:formate hydrogenlyase subunit 4 [mine drainage metagenome]|uniref:Formate hydrogenlyase subunit 4 n=1 Tax=mine drainage metagenome TaxID=410659 RepID=T0Z7G1_9ZZZZ